MLLCGCVILERRVKSVLKFATCLFDYDPLCKVSIMQFQKAEHEARTWDKALNTGTIPGKQGRLVSPALNALACL